ncbi:hypothetical protein SAMD00023378_3960 [Ralstonia sp. NT80]|uniref:DUF2591 domain-containing protein n=1 Tax=Ralstonia sp. NT80 TaxID=1218247 RepID=UPI00066C2250|nr:DUF2591 domain-containing protein [Ralstonia sp. NT80]GAQ30277.1 hypothetical protein SAMD00023378_3960 [Ralstonia sp. NT80]
MKVAELEGPLLDYWVARAEGEVLAPAHAAPDPNSGTYWLKIGRFASVKPCPQYSSRWSDGGPIIEREQIATVSADFGWDAIVYGLVCAGGIEGSATGQGDRPLIAAMRAYVASKFGEEVPDVDAPPVAS